MKLDFIPWTLEFQPGEKTSSMEEADYLLIIQVVFLFLLGHIILFHQPLALEHAAAVKLLLSKMQLLQEMLIMFQKDSRAECGVQTRHPLFWTSHKAR